MTILEFPATSDRFTRMVEEALASAEQRVDGVIHPTQRASLRTRLAAYAREAEVALTESRITLTLPPWVEALSEAQRADLLGLVRDTGLQELVRAYRWGLLQFIDLAVELEDERLKRHMGR